MCTYENGYSARQEYYICVLCAERTNRVMVITAWREVADSVERNKSDNIHSTLRAEFLHDVLYIYIGISLRQCYEKRENIIRFTTAKI